MEDTLGLSEKAFQVQGIARAKSDVHEGPCQF